MSPSMVLVYRKPLQKSRLKNAVRLHGVQHVFETLNEVEVLAEAFVLFLAAESVVQTFEVVAAIFRVGSNSVPEGLHLVAGQVQGIGVGHAPCVSDTNFVVNRVDEVPALCQNFLSKKFGVHLVMGVVSPRLIRAPSLVAVSKLVRQNGDEHVLPAPVDGTARPLSVLRCDRVGREPGDVHLSLVRPAVVDSVTYLPSVIALFVVDGDGAVLVVLEELHHETAEFADFFVGAAGAVIEDHGPLLQVR